MTQRDRDRLVVLKKAGKKLITQKQAAAELQLSERQVRRLLKGLKAHGDRAVIHGLRGRPSNRRLDEEQRQQAIAMLSLPEWRDLGPTLASYHLRQDHGIRKRVECRHPRIGHVAGDADALSVGLAKLLGEVRVTPTVCAHQHELVVRQLAGATQHSKRTYHRLDILARLECRH